MIIQTFPFSLFQTIRSYIYPIKLEETQDPYYLSLTLEKSILVLNSIHANQSNQDLKYAFHLAFHKLDIYSRKFDKTLILGFGLGSVISLLQKNQNIN